MRVILLGPPGVGKGTQGVRIAAHYGATHVSTGAMLRDAITEGRELGLKVKPYMDLGKLAPDDVMIGVVEDRMERDDVERGFVLDGFPRTVPQAQALDAILERHDLPVDYALVIDAPVETIVKRISGRRVCSICGRNYHVDFHPPRLLGTCDEGHGPLIQRPDDRESVVRDRLSVYARETCPLVDFFRKRGILLEVAGDGPPDEVFGRVVAGLGSAGRAS